MKFEDTVFRSYPTGSRYICNPAPKDTDNDTVFLVNGYYDWASILLEDGWEDCGQYDKGGDFRSFRKGEENYIVTENDNFFSNYVKATTAARALNLLEKQDRITLFQAIMDAGEGYEGFAIMEGVGPFGLPNIRNPRPPVEIHPGDELRVGEERFRVAGPVDPFEFDDPFIAIDDDFNEDGRDVVRPADVYRAVDPQQDRPYWVRPLGQDAAARWAPDPLARVGMDRQQELYQQYFDGLAAERQAPPQPAPAVGGRGIFNRLMPMVRINND